MAMVFKIKLKYHHLLLAVLWFFSWTMLLCSIGFQYFREKQLKIDHFNSQLQLYNQYLIKIIDKGETFDNIFIPDPNLRITIVAPSGCVIYDNKYDSRRLNNHRNRPEIRQAMEEGSGYTLDRVSNSDGLEYFYSAARSKYCIVRTAMPYNESLDELLSADVAFFWFMFIVTLVMSLLGWFVMHQLGLTITRLNQFAAQAEKGEPIEKMTVFPHNELGEISRHIINLYTELQDTIVDRDQKHKQALQQEQEKIRIKRQLTQNINHELKTPVSSIQVCLETLLSGPQVSKETHRKLLEQCYSNCERLCHLLNDVSLITRLEEGSMLIQKEPVCINDILEEISNEMNILPEEKCMDLHIDMQEKVTINANKQLIASIFRNLTENAIAYSEGQNIYVRSFIEDPAYIGFIFEDDGVGVDPKHLSHLFERFYRVDKGRSRKMGGTGLGLSIVKHAVKFHEGDIQVRRSEKGGLKFTFTLKK